jgi:hypothetical protein
MRLDYAIQVQLASAATCRWEMAKWAAMITAVIADPRQALALFDEIRRVLRGAAVREVRS